MNEPLEISRRVRKQIRGRDVRADIAADLSVAVSTGRSASVRQRSSIAQGGMPPASAPDDKEQP